MTHTRILIYSPRTSVGLHMQYLCSSMHINQGGPNSVAQTTAFQISNITIKEEHATSARKGLIRLEMQHIYIYICNDAYLLFRLDTFLGQSFLAGPLLQGRLERDKIFKTRVSTSTRMTQKTVVPGCHADLKSQLNLLSVQCERNIHPPLKCMKAPENDLPTILPSSFYLPLQYDAAGVRKRAINLL